MLGTGPGKLKACWVRVLLLLQIISRLCTHAYTPAAAAAGGGVEEIIIFNIYLLPGATIFKEKQPCEDTHPPSLPLLNISPRHQCLWPDRPVKGRTDCQ